VGELEGDVNYREFLRSKGVDVPATVYDDDSMDEVSADVSVTMEENTDNDDVQVGTPLQGNAIGANEKETSTHMSRHRHTYTSIHHQQTLQRTSTDIDKKPRVLRSDKLPNPVQMVKSF
jgi:hypothetical protein